MSLFLAAVAGVSAFAQGTGSVSGTITSAATRNALQGAVVSIPSLNRSELTDNAGAFTISGLPAGSLDVVISYAGFEETRRTVTVRAGEAARLDTDLKTANAVMMEAYTVATVREGQALALTEQRQAPNMKNVTAFDEWGILPTQNVGELVSRLPGITFTTDEDNLINNVSIGGLPASYTRLNIDGMSSTGVGGDGRQATLHSFSASQYEAVEIIAGQTPERRADGLGGQLNLKTASPLAMRDRRRVSYTVSGRWMPPFSNRQEAIADRALKPDFSASYQEVFDVAGGVRNLGVLVGASYQEVLNPHDWDTLLYEATTNPVAQLRDYTRTSGSNLRFISAASVRADYRWSQATRVSLRFLYNAGSEPFFNYTAVNPWASANLTVFDATTNPNGSILPGYTAKQIAFRPTTTAVNGNTVGAAQMRLFPQKYSFTSRNPTGTLAFEHNWGRLKVDHAYRWSKTHWDSGAGRNREGGTVAMRTRDAIGFSLDYSDPQGRIFRQTAGPSVYDASSYAAFTLANATATQPVPQTSTVLTKRDTITDTNEVSGQINAAYTLPTELPLTFKAGVDTVNRRVNNKQVYPRRWYMVPGGVVPTAGLMPVTEFERLNGGPRLPIVDPAAVSTTLGNTALWYEDVNFTATSQFTNRRIFEESVDAAYVQGSTRFGRFNLLGGVRGEWIATDTFTFYRRITTPIASEPDHFKRAALDYAPAGRDGGYHKFFPSVHASYDITSNLKARASWSTSYGRPTLAQVISGVTPNPAALPIPTLTMGNPDLKPQMAKNVDLKLEYYYGDGFVSVRGYRKKITDYISSTSSRSGELVPTGPDNGFGGLYEGYEIVQVSNAGNASYRGVEVDFRQRLAFLPGAFKGLAVRANYFYGKSEGNFGAATTIGNGAVAGFIPRSYNVGLTYTYGRFMGGWDMNFTGRYPVVNVSTTAPQGNRFREPWKVMNLQFSYKFYRDNAVFLNVSNLTEEGRNEYIFVPSRMRSEWVIPRALKFGVNGRF